MSEIVKDIDNAVSEEVIEEVFHVPEHYVDIPVRKRLSLDECQKNKTDKYPTIDSFITNNIYKS